MTLTELLEGVNIKDFHGNREVKIKGVVHDSRSVGDGDLFVAIRGESFNGLDFIGEAFKGGASAVLFEGGPVDLPESATSVVVDNSREALALVANNFYGRPSLSLSVLGVTGTNGKTTVTHIIKSILNADGTNVGLIGTISNPPFTTPESLEFQRLMSDMLKEGCSHVVAEVSSHALSQRRVDGTSFRLAVFTNLTRDHLDFHGDMEAYFGAKKRLFEELLRGPAVINIDDPYGMKLLEAIKGEVLTYGIKGNAALIADEIETFSGGLSFVLRHKGKSSKVQSPMLGIFNVYNLLAAAGACIELGLPWESIIKGLAEFRGVRGRFEKVECGQEFLCVVDYAHTEDALRGLILTARKFTEGRLITLFGCGGQRDSGKRPAMGAVATELSDWVFITSDNPRAEDPEEIIKDILSGVKKKNYVVEPDRAKAIKEAVREAKASDTVLIAGKGHEEYQEVMGNRTSFSDKEEAMKAIRKVMSEHA
jgi:UDP-N-acetylmuramoyl-L-alanyl-D-glutamate--2,6-diaminopimelate ligase